jgi:hypothetical protein
MVEIQEDKEDEVLEPERWLECCGCLLSDSDELFE